MVHSPAELYIGEMAKRKRLEVRLNGPGFLSLPEEHWPVSERNNPPEWAPEVKDSVMITVLSKPMFYLSKLNRDST